MTVVHVTIVREDDEHLAIEVNGEVIASANYDEHGSSGMDAVEKTACAIAKAAGLTVTEEWGRDDEDGNA